MKAIRWQKDWTDELKYKSLEYNYQNYILICYQYKKAMKKATRHMKNFYNGIQ